LRSGIGKPVEEICANYLERVQMDSQIGLGAIQTIREGGITDYTWQERMTVINQLREKLFKDLEPILPSPQGKVLLIAVRTMTLEDSSWIGLAYLISQIKKETDMDEEEISSVIDDLSKNRLLRKGASLPI
jgi:hypothetical protein